MRDLDKDRRNADDGQVEALDAERIANEVAGLDRGTDPFVAAVRATRMPMIVTNPRLPDNPVVFANDAFCRLTGYERSEILGRNCRFLQGPDTAPDTVKRIHEAVKNAAPIEIDIRNYRKDGSAFWNRLLLAPVYDGYGALAYFFASQLDVTRDREKMEGLRSRNAALSAELTNRLAVAHERERELELAMAAGGLGAWSVDVASRSLAASEAYKALLGWPTDRPMTYEDRQSLIHPEDRDAVRAQSDATIQEGADYDITHRIVTPQGETLWMKARGVLISDVDGAPLRIAGVTQDITREVRSQKMRTALVELSDALRDLDDPADISYAAAQVLGSTLEVSRAGYGLVDRQAETITIDRDWNAPGIKTLAGVPVGKIIQAARPDCEFLGEEQARVEWMRPNGKYTLMLLHPGGGSSYALSYRPQKIVESLEGGTKPDMLAIGHYHKADFIPSYRNVAAIQVGAFQKQTPFMARQGLAAHVGGWIVDVTVGDGHNTISAAVTAFYV
jgi:PAS domain S-box-containing protein